MKYTCCISAPPAAQAGEPTRRCHYTDVFATLAFFATFAIRYRRVQKPPQLDGFSQSSSRVNFPLIEKILVNSQQNTAWHWTAKNDCFCCESTNIFLPKFFQLWASQNLNKQEYIGMYEQFNQKIQSERFWNIQKNNLISNLTKSHKTKKK